MSVAQPARPAARVFRFRQSEALLPSVMENSAIGLALAGSKGRLTYTNRAYSRMFGYGPDECIGLTPRELVHPDDRAAAEQQVALLARGEIDGHRAERRFLKKDGGWFWGMSSASAVRDEDGRPGQLIIQVIDIDREKRTEEALAASESRWSFALEGAGQGVWDHDLRRRTAFYSRTWKTMRGLEPDEDVDSSKEAWLARVHPDDRARILDEVRRQDSGELAQNSFEYRERHRDGRWIWILSRGKPVEWMADGSVARIIGTDTDITSLKTAQAQLAEEKETAEGHASLDRRRRDLHRPERPDNVHEPGGRAHDRVPVHRRSGQASPGSLQHCR
jgi:PAS domain S-box-containing protein